MTKAEWRTWSECPSFMLRALEPERTSERKLLLFGVACCQPLLKYNLRAGIGRGVAWVERRAEDTPRPTRVGFRRLDTRGAQGLADIACSAVGALTDAVGKPLVDEPELLEEVCYAVGDGERQRHYGSQNASIREFRVQDLQPLVRDEVARQCDLLRDIFGNPFGKRPEFKKAWQTDTAVTLARQMYDSREFSAMPI